ncbi:S-adenosyl-L-methionine:benzoic acid/salicylic acid carboxyl methyltransferase 2-like [Corylus avellana]|uniref:S-adenosyl-L-methionine:benzoic acid/salicylic acid carboxyl methyltransferase 2-like n=1 Tax=Corylus avellana TaxID=13451 RepID=UPI00286C6C69|nr:S-adenosyl-L-methionine:benzoic acid/salicylic acid carboxyl methyltransferase 2-like [Corylus avellana]XP_059444184.1 S-adenosyl-L-methionine:benzoic acid/salicylic acid carboxyl methyltransferase 2-like [Corylus avellana]
MEVAQVLHMNGGMGNTSYANNSLLQQKVISMTKPITEEVISNLYSSMSPRTLAMADLGCSSGPNTLVLVSQLMEVVHNLWRKLGHDQSPEYQVFLSDLPGNDFNTIFMSVPSFLKKMSLQLGPASGPCFLSGVPGSFYGRLFPANSLHLVHSSYSLHWLSQVPEGLGSNNKGNIYMASTSPPGVLCAYYEQFQRDFSIFLKCRAEELVGGGRMVLTILGRRSEDPSSKECCYIWELLATALNDMVSEGLIDEEKLDSFNIPKYTPSPSEVESEVVKDGSFCIDRLEVSEINWNAYDSESFSSSDAFSDGGYNVAKCMRAVAEPLLVTHFGDAIIEEVFCRYKEILSDRISKEKTQFTNVTIALTKRG